MGLAVLLNGELVEWKVKTFQEAWSQGKKRAILDAIQRMCIHHAVKTIIIKQMEPPFTPSKKLKGILYAIATHAKKNKIRVRYFYLSELDYDMRTGKRQTKLDVSKVAERHPELKIECTKERANRATYYTKMFEAVAAAEMTA
jgi:hypothetical protein